MSDNKLVGVCNQDIDGAIDRATKMRIARDVLTAFDVPDSYYSIAAYWKYDEGRRNYDHNRVHITVHCYAPSGEWRDQMQFVHNLRHTFGIRGMKRDVSSTTQTYRGSVELASGHTIQLSISCDELPPTCRIEEYTELVTLQRVVCK